MLIQPPYRDTVRTMLSHMDDKGTAIGAKAPLGLLYIAAYLKSAGFEEVQVLDAQAGGLDYQECLRRAEDYAPRIVGISAWTDWWYSAWKLGRMIKDKIGAFLVYGGPHPGIYPRETLEASGADAVVLGDGEVPFAEFCRQVQNNDFRETDGLLFKNGSRQPSAYCHSRLDELPIPDRAMLNLKDYTSVIGKARFGATMITSRGCPFHCSFCKLSFQPVNFRSAGNVVEEFRRIRDLGIREVEIYDDTFTWSRSRVLEICSTLSREKTGIAWSVRDRVSSADEALLEAMKEAGCNRIHYGIESGVQEVLDRIQKKITVEQAERAVRLAKNKGFIVLTYFMMGLPGETRRQIEQTIDFARRLDADYAEFSITIPYPGTAVYLEALKKKTIAADFWREFALRPVPGFRIPQLSSELPVDELVSLRNEAVRRYYFRPRFVLREIGRSRSGYELLRKAGMGLRLLGSLCKRREPAKRERR